MLCCTVPACLTDSSLVRRLSLRQRDKLEGEPDLTVLGAADEAKSLLRAMADRTSAEVGSCLSRLFSVAIGMLSPCRLWVSQPYWNFAEAQSLTQAVQRDPTHVSVAVLRPLELSKKHEQFPMDDPVVKVRVRLPPTFSQVDGSTRYVGVANRSAASVIARTTLTAQRRDN